MKRYGENFKLTQELMNTIASYMDDDKREYVHFELAPCEPEEFLKRYLELDSDFEELLNNTEPERLLRQKLINRVFYLEKLQMDKWIEKIENLLKDNGIEFETSNNYINILNSSTMTRIKFFEYECGTIGKCTAIFVQEFDCFGNETYNKEFVTFGKRFIDRVKRNVG